MNDQDNHNPSKINAQQGILKVVLPGANQTSTIVWTSSLVLKPVLERLCTSRNLRLRDFIAKDADTGNKVDLDVPIGSLPAIPAEIFLIASTTHTKRVSLFNKTEKVGNLTDMVYRDKRAEEMAEKELEEVLSRKSTVSTSEESESVSSRGVVLPSILESALRQLLRAAQNPTKFNCTTIFPKVLSQVTTLATSREAILRGSLRIEDISDLRTVAALALATLHEFPIFSVEQAAALVKAWEIEESSWRLCVIQSIFLQISLQNFQVLEFVSRFIRDLIQQLSIANRAASQQYVCRCFAIPILLLTPSEKLTGSNPEEMDEFRDDVLMSRTSSVRGGDYPNSTDRKSNSIAQQLIEYVVTQYDFFFQSKEIHTVVVEKNYRLISSAPIPILIDKLIDDNYNEQDYIDAFYCCHDYFISQADLLKSLIRLFPIFPKNNPGSSTTSANSPTVQPEWEMHKRKRILILIKIFLLQIPSGTLESEICNNLSSTLQNLEKNCYKQEHVLFKSLQRILQQHSQKLIRALPTQPRPQLQQQIPTPVRISHTHPGNSSTTMPTNTTTSSTTTKTSHPTPRPLSSSYPIFPNMVNGNQQNAFSSSSPTLLYPSAHSQSPTMPSNKNHHDQLTHASTSTSTGSSTSGTFSSSGTSGTFTSSGTSTSTSSTSSNAPPTLGPPPPSSPPPPLTLPPPSDFPPLLASGQRPLPGHPTGIPPLSMPTESLMPPRTATVPPLPVNQETSHQPGIPNQQGIPNQSPPPPDEAPPRPSSPFPPINQGPPPPSDFPPVPDFRLMRRHGPISTPISSPTSSLPVTASQSPPASPTSRVRSRSRSPTGNTRVQHSQQQSSQLPSVLLQDLLQYSESPLNPRASKRSSVSLNPAAFLAEQLAIIDLEMCQNISVNELLKKSWESPVTAPGVHKLTQHFNQLSTWVQISILLADRGNPESQPHAMRREIVNLFLEVAQELTNYRDFHGAMAFFSALQSASISRLKVWRDLPKKFHKTWTQLQHHYNIDKNYQNYRHILDAEKFPCVPCLVITTKDLVAIEENNPTKTSEGHVNFQKFRMLFRLVKFFRKIKFSKFPFQKNQAMHTTIHTAISSITINDKGLYTLSTNIEPKEKDKDREKDSREKESTDSFSHTEEFV